MSEITKDKLWRLHQLVQAKHRGMTHYRINTMSGVITLTGQGCGELDCLTIDAALDYLDPPKPPTYDELIEFVKWFDMTEGGANIWRKLPSEITGKVRDFCDRHNRAKAARRDE